MAWVENRGTTWRVRYWKTDSGTGSIGGFPTRDAAQTHADALNTGQTTAPGTIPHHHHQPPAPPTPPPGTTPQPAPEPQITLAQWAETWWQTIDVGPNTEEFYRSLLSRHLLPFWGGTPLQEITPAEVKIWLNAQRPRYAPTTIKSLRKLIAMIMADAVEEGLIATNPIRPERRGRGRLQPRPEKAWIDEHQLLIIAQRVLRLAARNQCLLILTAGYTGMRWGELAGLHRDNVDLHQGAINVTATGALHEVNGQLSLGHPKTLASVRTAALPPFLTELLTIDLAAHRREFVFTSLHGAQLRRSGFQRRYWAPAARGGTHLSETWPPVNERLTFHGLRHSHKTWMIEDGIPEVAQARRLGHTLPDKIVDTYSHVAASIEARLLAALQARWERSLRGLTGTEYASNLRALIA